MLGLIKRIAGKSNERHFDSKVNDDNTFDEFMSVVYEKKERNCQLCVELWGFNKPLYFDAHTELMEEYA